MSGLRFNCCRWPTTERHGSGSILLVPLRMEFVGQAAQYGTGRRMQWCSRTRWLGIRTLSDPNLERRNRVLDYCECEQSTWAWATQEQCTPETNSTAVSRLSISNAYNICIYLWRMLGVVSEFKIWSAPALLRSSSGNDLSRQTSPHLRSPKLAATAASYNTQTTG